MARRRTGARSVRRRAAQPAAESGVAPAAPAVAPAGAVADARPGAVAGDWCPRGAWQIREAGERKAQLCAALDAGANGVDLEGMAAVDTAGVQLLVAAAQEAARRQRPLRLRNCPPVLREAVRSLGLAALLEPLMVEPA